MKRNSGIRRGKTPFRSVARLKSHKPMRKMSAKARARLPSRKECVEIVRKRCDNLCEIGARIMAVDAAHRCGLWCEDVHEMLYRSGGGDETDPDECLGSCRACHRWAHAHKKIAIRIGIVRSSHSSTEEHREAPAPSSPLSGLGEMISELGDDGLRRD